MKNKLKSVVSVFLCVLTLFSTFPVYASSIQIDNKTHDYSDINTLPEEYSYGTLFWTDSTSVEPIQYNSKYFKNNYTHSVTYGACVGEILKLKINSCSIDKDGDLCDVLITVGDVKVFSKYTVNNKFGPDFGESTSDPANCRIEIAITQLDSNFGDLIYFWFNTNGASASFNMQYVKTGTNTPANINNNVSTFYDFDVPSIKNRGLEEEYYEGNEGISVPSSTVYYDKSNSTGYLVDADNLPSGYDIGVCTPSYSTVPVYSNSPEKQTSCVVIQKLNNSTFKMHYSGRSCGVAWVFISPYSYDVASPDISVDADEVYEGQTFNYTISQYVPNNYYAETLHFIEDVGGHYSIFTIKNQLSDKLTINGNIVVKNESGNDVTLYFDISTNGNCVLANLKSQYLSDKNFYSHIYNVIVPVYINKGTGLSQSFVSNSAETIFENNLESNTYETKDVDVSLKYDVNISSTIDHGFTYINSNEPSASDVLIDTVSHGGNSSNIVYFEVADGYNLKTVTVDGSVVGEDDIIKTGNVYSYEFTDNDIKEDIHHSLDVTTELKDAMVTVKYVDDKGSDLTDDVVINGKVFDTYKTEEKSFYGYFLAETPENATGTMTVEPITVTYVYELKDAEVTVKYVDDEGESLAEDEVITGKVFDKYNTEAKSFYGYKLLNTPVNATGTMTEDDIEVIYVYTKKQSTVTVNYISDDNKVLETPITTTGNVGDAYSTAEKDIYGYELIEIPSNAQGEYTEDNIIVNYVYKLKDAFVTVNYVTDTGIVLNSSVKLTGKVFDEYTTENKQFTGYELIAIPENASGTMTEDAIVVNYVYRLKDTSVLVNYVTDEGEELTDSVKIDGKVFDSYTTQQKTFYGYELTVVPENASGNMTETQIVVNYVYKLKTSSVTARYVDENGEEIEDSVLIKGDVFSEYETKSKSIYGYELTETPNNASGEITEEPITVTYVYRLKDATVNVYYVDENGESLCDSVKIDGKVFDKYQTESKDIYGYTLTAVPDNAEGTMTEDSIDVKYVYSLNGSSVLVNYVDGNNHKLSDSVTIEGNVFDEYQTESKEFYGYNLTVIPDNAAGIMTDEQIVVNYVYELKDTSVVVNYVTDDGRKLSDSITLVGKVFDDYNTEEKSFYGYSLVSVPKNNKGTMTEESITVNYIYTLKQASVKVNYIDEDGNPLSDSVIINGKVFDKYETESKDIYGYTLKSVTDNASGTMTEDIITVNYVYSLNDASVFVDYLEDNGYKLHDTVTINGKVFDKYTTEEKTFYGYYLASKSDNTSGTMKDEPINVIYTYMLKNASVTANYLSDTGEVLDESVVINGKVFDEYSTSEKTIYGYFLMSVPSNSTGTMTELPIVVNYIYKLKDTSVIVNYVDENGNMLADSETINGKVFDEYQTSQKDIYGYKLKSVNGNVDGVMTEDVIVIDYVYELKDTDVLVNYTDENGNELADSVIIEGYVFDDYETENKSFYGYNLTVVPDNANGVMTEDEIIVNYIYELKDTDVIVNYVTDNGDVLGQSVIINGKVFDEYETESKEFYGYSLIAVPENAKGSMTEEEIVVNYVYELKPAVVNVYYVDENGEDIADSINIDGKVFDEYTTEDKTIYGYNLAKTPNNVTGVMTEDEIDVVYVYALKPAVVNVNYVDKDGNIVADSETINGKVFDKYKTSSKQIDGYKLSAKPDNAKGEMTEELIVVNYIYEKLPEPDVPYTGAEMINVEVIFIGIAVCLLLICLFLLAFPKFKRSC